MNRSDKTPIIIVIILIIIYLLVWINGSVNDRPAYFISIVNILTGLGILIYWIQKQLRITRHIFEGREFIVLFLELAVVVAASYLVITGSTPVWLKLITYIIFATHLLGLAAGLIFLLTFKMKKLI